MVCQKIRATRTCMPSGPHQLTSAYFNLAASSATRLPSRRAVSRSPLRGASSGDASDGEMASAPPKPALQLTSAGPCSFLFDGKMPVPTHIWLCCMARVQKYWMVENLSPLSEAEFVKPAATLFFQSWPNQALDDLSANFLNCHAGPPI